MVNRVQTRRMTDLEYEAEIARLTAERDELACSVERLESALAEAAHAATEDEESFPDAVVERLVAGENPIRVFREHRGLSIRKLAEAAGISAGYLSDIETGKRTGTTATIKALAEVLAVDLDMLV